MLTRLSSGGAQRIGQPTNNETGERGRTPGTLKHRVWGARWQTRSTPDQAVKLAPAWAELRKILNEVNRVLGDCGPERQ